MASGRFGASLSSPDINVSFDMGNPFLNITVDGFLKIATVAATKVLAEDGYDSVRRGKVTVRNIQNTLEKMCKKGAYWGTIGGVYVGMEYGIERARGTRDWKNALLGGALAGALISAAGNNSKDRIINDAFAGGAIATAATFINYPT